MKRPLRPRGEEGSALVMALFFVTIFGLFVAAVISFVEVGLRASNSFEEQARAAYATDGAVNAAVNRFRSGGACDNFTSPTGPDGLPLYGEGVIVRCVDDDRPASGRATKPVNALLALGADPGEGISTSAGFEQRIVGNIFSNSRVAAGATLIVQGQVSAIGDCTGVQTSPVTPLRCANEAGGADPSHGRDPDYTKARSTVPARQTVPPCPAGWLVTLEPGYYDDAAALSAFTTTAGACPGKVVWMKPGNYYLDFTFRGGAGTWMFDDPTVDVVAGTPKNWDPASPTRPAITLPGSCRTAADGASNEGVQLVAGGGTHFQITSGRVELCAEPSLSDQSIALYGMPGDRPVHDLQPTDWVDVSVFDAPVNATTVGEGPSPLMATAELAAGSAASAAITLTAFRPRIPEGSHVDSATLRVVHQDIGAPTDLGAGSIKVSVPDSACAAGVGLPVRPTLAEDRVDLMVSCGITTPAALNDLEAMYTVALAAGGADATAHLDGIAVEVAYRTPVTGKPTVVTASTGFAPPANALEIAEQPVALTADAALSVAAPTASITVAGLGDPPIPRGSTIDSAVLRVAHREEGQMAQPTVGVSVPGCTSLLVPTRFGSSVVDDRIDLKAPGCGLDQPEELVGLTATYTVALDSGGTAATARLDGMWLELVYRPPTLTAATVTPGPSPGAFADPDQAKIAGEQPNPLTADATLTSGSPTATLAFANFDPTATVPGGALLDRATLRVVHQDLGPMDAPTLIVTYPGGSCAPALTKRAATLGTDAIDLTAPPCGLTDPTTLAAIGVTYTANLTGGTVTPPDATARVDGVVLDLAYRPPSVRRPSVATTSTPGFASPDNAKAIAEQPTPLTADVTLANGAPSATVTVEGFNVVPLPAGSVIDSAVLRVAHQDDPWLGAPTLTTTFPGSTCVEQTLAVHAAALGTDRSVDLTTCGLDNPDDLAGLAATYTVVAPPAATDATHQPTTAGAVTGFADADNAKAIGEFPEPLTADAALSGATPASMILGGFGQGAPPGASPITAAVLRIAHQEDAGVAPVTATVSFTGATCGPRTFALRATLGTDTIDLVADCGLTTASQLADLTVTYDAALDLGAADATARLDGAELDLTYQATSGTDRLDGIELDIIYRAPTFRPLDGCLTMPYPGTGCALVSVQPAGDTDVATRFVANGTVYAPTAALDISMNGVTSQVLSRGLVARTIRLGLRPAARYDRPVMGVPPEPVRFTAYPDVRATPGTATPLAFTGADDARAIDGAVAEATLSDSGPSAASVTLSDFAQTSLPAGAPIDSAVLRVVHREDPGIESVTITVNGLASPCSKQIPRVAGTTLGEDQIDIAACGGFSALTDLSTLTVTYAATLPPGSPATPTIRLDGITLDLLSGPLLRARVAFDTTQDTVHVEGWSVLR